MRALTQQSPTKGVPPNYEQCSSSKIPRWCRQAPSALHLQPTHGCRRERVQEAPDTCRAWGTVVRSSAERPPRWTLNRAGIINVYQYGDETLEFGGGRLLLR